MKEKLRYVFLPWILISSSAIAVGLLLYWLLILLPGFDGLTEMLTHYWIPAAFGGLVAWLGLRRRLKLLRLETRHGKDYFAFYYFMTAATIAVPLIIGIHLLDTATGKLVTLDKNVEIYQYPRDRFFDLSGYVINKTDYGFYSVAERRGKYGGRLHYTLYLTLPVQDHLDEFSKEPVLFLGVEYNKEISNKLEDSQKKKIYRQFVNESMRHFEQELNMRFEYLQRLPNSNRRTDFLESAKRSAIYKGTTEPVVLLPVKEAFADRNGSKLSSSLWSVGISWLVWLIMVAIPRMNEHALKRYGKPMSRREKLLQWSDWEILLPRKGIVATPVLVWINVLVMLVMALGGVDLIQPRAMDLLAWGGLNSSKLADGQWWRLLTVMFVHGGLAHLFMNMVSLLIAGQFLEPAVGTKKFLLIYFICGVLAAMVSVAYAPLPVKVGASGAIFGLFGGLLATTFFSDKYYSKLIWIILASTAGVGLIYGLLSEGVDNAAHFGGLVAGVGVGYMLIGKINVVENA
ncbi:rhomboid family intramembrane serine protease [Flavihumibacter sediminis]|nr:rhomboid family intramembrane serine protease [Flavihumibacter sediminis]